MVTHSYGSQFRGHWSGDKLQVTREKLPGKSTTNQILTLRGNTLTQQKVFGKKTHHHTIGLTSVWKL